MEQQAAREAALFIGGRIGFVALWFLATLLIYRGLGSDAAGLSQAGLFAVAIACVKIVSSIAVESVDVALMRHAPGLLRGNPNAAYRLFRAAFWLRGGTTLAVVSILLVFAPSFSRDILGHPEAAPLIRYVGAAIIGDMLLRSEMVVLQASERFMAFVLLEGLMQVLRFGSIVTLWLLGTIEVELVLACYATASFVAVLVGMMWLPRGIFASARFDRADMVHLLHFLKWMMPAMILAAFSERLDILLVYGFRGSEEAGRYGAMLALALVPDIVAGCLSSLLQPRIARMREEGTYAAHLRQFLSISLPAATICFLLALLLARPMIALILGETYAESSNIFIWLLGGTLFWLAVTPLPMTMVAVHAPARVALVTVGQSAIVLSIGLLLLPTYGSVGMALGVVVMRVSTAVAMYVMSQRIAHSSSGEMALRQPRSHEP